MSPCRGGGSWVSQASVSGRRKGEAPRPRGWGATLWESSGLRPARGHAVAVRSVTDIFEQEAA